jgi:hypothetical protein
LKRGAKLEDFAVLRPWLLAGFRDDWWCGRRTSKARPGGVDATIAIGGLGALARSVPDPVQPTGHPNAQKPRTETEEKACSSERAKEAVK